MTGLLNLTTAKLKQIIALKQQIEKLSVKLGQTPRGWFGGRRKTWAGRNGP